MCIFNAAKSKLFFIPFQYGDIDYMDAKKSFTYDTDKYAGLPEFVDLLHDWGMR